MPRPIQAAAIALALTTLGLGACTKTASTSDQATEAAPAPAAAGAEPALATDDDKTIYAVGAVLGERIESFDLTEPELDALVAGLRDKVLGHDLAVDVDTYRPSIQALEDSRIMAAAKAEKEASAAFAAEFAKRPGAEVSDSGLIYIPTTEGDGEHPSATDTVRVHYHGTLRDGTVFDSSVERGKPISIALNQVIPCWTEGVQKMAVGGKATLVCPSDIAYGDRGNQTIPGGATLVFEVQLLAIE